MKNKRSLEYLEHVVEKSTLKYDALMIVTMYLHLEHCFIFVLLCLSFWIVRFFWYHFFSLSLDILVTCAH